MKASIGISWEQRANLPANTNAGKPVLLNGKVYCEGILVVEAIFDVDIGDMPQEEKLRYIVRCYDPVENEWTTLPQLPVYHIGLGAVNGQLVAVGGVSNTDGRESNNVYTYNEQSKEWIQTIDPMPTSRALPSCFSLQSALVVAGGGDSSLTNSTDVVEIFKPDTSLWYTANPLPTPCADISLVAIGNTLYALGGFDGEQHLAQCFHTLVDDLLQSTFTNTPNTRNIAGDPDNDNTPSSWRELSDMPTYDPTGAELAGNLIAVGGVKSADEDAAKKEIYMYSPASNSWIYINDLPAPLFAVGVTALSPSEILVIGGRCSGNRKNFLYKGTLSLKI